MGRKRKANGQMSHHENRMNTPHQPSHATFSHHTITAVRELFKKKFIYSSSSTSPHLPEAESLFCASPWWDEDLLKLGESLNTTKNRLSELDITSWHQHTNLTNVAGSVVGHLCRNFRPELCTQAWCKFTEVLGNFQLVPSHADGCRAFCSVHLCEAPGAFVASLNHHMKSNRCEFSWQWIANTLNPYHEGNSYSCMIDDDRLIANTASNWCFANDDTGDVMTPANANFLVSAARKLGEVHLVTADGSVDCADKPAEQELLVSQLLLCELVTALRILSPGGSIVIKMFTLLESPSVSLVYLLYLSFEQLNVYKPATSKAGNSEVYVVALGYKGTPYMAKLTQSLGHDIPGTVMFSRDQIDDAFMEQHKRCCQMFINYQIAAIDCNLRLFHALPASTKEELSDKRDCCAVEFVERYKIREIGNDDRIVPLEISHAKRKRTSSLYDYVSRRRRHEGSFLERQTRLNLDWRERITQMSLYDDVLCHSTISFKSESDLDPEVVQQWTPVIGRNFVRVHSSKFVDRSLLQHYMLLLDNKQSVHGGHADCMCSEKLAQVIVTNMGMEWNGQTVVVDMVDRSDDLVLRHVQGQCHRKMMMILRADELLDTNPACTLWWLECQMAFGSEMSAIIGAGERSWLLLDQLLQLNPHRGDACLLVCGIALTRLTTSAVFILYQIFDEVTIFSCNCTPRLHVLATGYRGQSGYLRQCVHRMTTEILARSEDHEMSVLSVVPVRYLSELNFYTHIRSSNDNQLKQRINFLVTEENHFFEKRGDDEMSS